MCNRVVLFMSALALTSCVTVMIDYDGDTIPDTLDNCPLESNIEQYDFEYDGIGDVCDRDDDNDGIDDTDDNCQFAPNSTTHYPQSDIDGDGYGDECDVDIDNDGVYNVADNCVEDGNIEQSDMDGDTIGDVCDGDLDGDSAGNEKDNCPYISNDDQRDSDRDGIGDECDPCPNVAELDDRDGDCYNDNYDDNCPNLYNPAQVNSDHDDIGDACDFCPYDDFVGYQDVDADGFRGTPTCEYEYRKFVYEGDCNDNDSGVSPKATETINGTDDDCDGLVDEKP